MHQTTDIISLKVHQRGLKPQTLHGETFDRDIETLLDQIDQGLRADDATNFEKLKIARRYGPLLIQLKAMVPHGQFKQVLKERFPRVSYSKCNRWMNIAKGEIQVAKVLDTYPDVAWGPKKMIDFLQGRWSPEVECDEDECYGVTPDNRIEPDDEPYYSEIDDEAENEADGTDEGEIDAYDSCQIPSDVQEAFVAKAEAEAKLIGQPPDDSPMLCKVAVTVFSQADLGAVENGLSQWNPKITSLKGSKQTHAVAASLPPNDIPTLLDQLSEALKKTLPTKLKVSIDL